MQIILLFRRFLLIKYYYFLNQIFILYENIHSKKDLDIECSDITTALNKKPGKYLSEIYDDIIYNILYRKLANNKESIIKYVVDNYKE